LHNKKEDKKIEKKRKKFGKKVQGPTFKINEEIKAPEVRVVADDLEESKIVPIEEALKMAEERELDLVEIAPMAKPPVCKITDYQRFIYEQKKKEKEKKAKAVKVVVKEIRFGPNTDEHDYNFKLKHAQNFLDEGNKVKATVFFRGRTIIYKNRGKELLEKLAEDLEEFGKVEKEPTMEGRRMTMIIAPKKSKKK